MHLKKRIVRTLIEEVVDPDMARPPFPQGNVPIVQAFREHPRQMKRVFLELLSPPSAGTTRELVVDKFGSANRNRTLNLSVEGRRNFQLRPAYP